MKMIPAVVFVVLAMMQSVWAQSPREIWVTTPENGQESDATSLASAFSNARPSVDALPRQRTWINIVNDPASNRQALNWLVFYLGNVVTRESVGRGRVEIEGFAVDLSKGVREAQIVRVTARVRGKETWGLNMVVKNHGSFLEIEGRVVGSVKDLFFPKSIRLGKERETSIDYNREIVYEKIAEIMAPRLAQELATVRPAYPSSSGASSQSSASSPSSGYRPPSPARSSASQHQTRFWYEKIPTHLRRNNQYFWVYRNDQFCLTIRLKRINGQIRVAIKDGIYKNAYPQYSDEFVPFTWDGIVGHPATRIH